MVSSIIISKVGGSFKCLKDISACSLPGVTDLLHLAGCHVIKSCFPNAHVLFSLSKRYCVRESRKENDMEIVNNCVGFKAKFPRSMLKYDFLYADTAGLESIRIIEKYNIHSFRIHEIYKHSASDRYRLVSCEVGKHEIEVFSDAMREIEKAFLIMGYRDYEVYCNKVFKEAV